MNGHPTATWSLPPGGQAQLIEIADLSTQGGDGSFLSLHEKILDTLQPGQTTYTSSTRLETGTYYVHVAGSDRACSGCPGREWSNVATLTIPNVAPAVSSISWGADRSLGRASALLQVCDDSGDVRVSIKQQRIHRRRVVATTTETLLDTILTYGDDNCDTLEEDWVVPSQLIRTGDIYRVTVVVSDEYGAPSAPVRWQVRWQ